MSLQDLLRDFVLGVSALDPADRLARAVKSEFGLIIRQTHAVRDHAGLDHHYLIAFEIDDRQMSPNVRQMTLYGATPEDAQRILDISNEVNIRGAKKRIDELLATVLAPSEVDVVFLPYDLEPDEDAVYRLGGAAKALELREQKRRSMMHITTRSATI